MCAISRSYHEGESIGACQRLPREGTYNRVSIRMTEEIQRREEKTEMLFLEKKNCVRANYTE
jgi:hypothetical protein